MNERESLAVESHSIDFVPLDERYGTPLRLFTIWISIQLSIVCATLNAMIYLLVPWSAINLADY